MLIISRKKEQKIMVADDIEVTILEVGRNRVRFGIKAPKHVVIQTRIKTTQEPAAGAVEAVGIVQDIEQPESLQHLPAAISMSKGR